MRSYFSYVFLAISTTLCLIEICIVILNFRAESNSLRQRLVHDGGQILTSQQQHIENICLFGDADHSIKLTSALKSFDIIERMQLHYRGTVLLNYQRADSLGPSPHKHEYTIKVYQHAANAFVTFSDSVYQDRMSELLSKTLQRILISVVLMLVVSYLISKNIVKPVTALSENISEHIRAEEKSFSKIEMKMKYVELENLLVTINSLTHHLLEREKDLKENHQLVRMIQDNTAEAIVILDDEMRIFDLNRSVETMFGYTGADLRGKPVEVLMGDKVFGRDKKILGKNGENASRLSKRSDAKRRDGQSIPVWVESAELVFTDKEFRALFIRDLTKDVEYREALEKSAEETRQAKEASRAKSEFLANMSHEIRTPMNGVIGMATLLSDTKLNTEQMDMVQTIQNSGESLMSIINDILDFSKIEAGKLNIEPIPFNLEIAIREVSELLMSRVDEKNIELIVNYVPETPKFVIGDPGRIRQVLINLVGNAIKFTQEGYVSINIEYRDKFMISVQDTGIGLPDDKINSLFEEFSQADNSTTRKYGGTGLGLSICKRLVMLMGGQIHARNRKGGGAEFYFDLDLPIDQSKKQVTALPEISLKGVKVLIVDDVDYNLEIIEQMLGKLEMRIETCRQPTKVLELMRMAAENEDPFQIIFLDYRMPELNGEELCKQIKGDPKLKEARLILHTSSGNRGDGARFSALGFSGYLPKPIFQDQLIDMLSLVWGSYLKGQDLGMVTHHTVKEQQEMLSGGREIDEETPGEAKARLRILVAEDNVVNQKVARKMIEKMNCRVDVVGNGKEALDIVQRLPYDLIFMDMQMPEMDGLEATKEIRNLEGVESNIPIVAMTANAMKGDKEKCIEVGMNDFISKPIKSEYVKNALDKWI